MKEIRGKSVLILGYGREGQSVHRFLLKHYPSLTVGVADQKDGKDYLQRLGGYDTVIRSPGVPGSLPQLRDYQKRGGWVTSATNIFFSLCPGVTIGVTGTKGKSTTASLIAHILKTAETYRDVRLVGNIGNPALDNLEGATRNTIFVIELSSHQLADIRYSPHLAVLLPIFPEHLDYYSDFEAYERAKANIVRFQTENDVVIFHPSVKKIADLSAGKKIPFSPTPASHFSLLGNRINIQAAVTVAKYFGVSIRLVRQALLSFRPLPHRLELVGEYRGIKFYNDSLATIPEATIHALEALGSEVETLIAGGYDRGLDFSKLGKYLAKSSLRTLILFPDTGVKIRRAIESYRGSHITYHAVKSMEEAVRLAYKHTQKGKICLLSPASASYNLFKNYEDRGNQFKELVRKLPGAIDK